MNPDQPRPGTSDDAVGADPAGGAHGTAERAAAPRIRRWLLTAVLASLAVVGAGAARSAGPSQHSSSDTPEMAMPAPDGVLDLTSVPKAVAAEYRYAADHAGAYRQMRCWCGCEQAFAHRSLLDCFVRADGRWEAHGAGCAVCITEAMTAHRRLDAGDTPADIARDLDIQFGPPPSAPTGA